MTYYRHRQSKKVLHQEMIKRGNGVALLKYSTDAGDAQLS
jgi:hypothetical protein